MLVVRKKRKNRTEEKRERNIRIAAERLLHGRKISELAKEYGIDDGALCRIVNRYEVVEIPDDDQRAN